MPISQVRAFPPILAVHTIGKDAFIWICIAFASAAITMWIATALWKSTDTRAGLAAAHPPLGSARIALVWIMLCVFLTLVVPGLVASFRGVFSEEGVLERMRNYDNTHPNDDRFVEVVASIDAYNERRKNLSADLPKINDQLRAPDAIAGDKLAGLIKLREAIQKEIDTGKPPKAVLGFYPHAPVLLWPALYSCLGWMLIGVKLSHKPIMSLRTLLTELSEGKTLRLAALIYAYYEWPHLARNLLGIGRSARTVFVFPNVDIDWLSFIVQEIEVFGFALLLAAVWYRWSGEYEKIKKAHLAMKEISLAHLSEQVVQTFVHWIYSSLLLLGGFLFMANFYWSLTAQYLDKRYFPSAILLHSLWGISWLFISLPFLTTWRAWNRSQFAEIWALRIEETTKADEKKFRLDLLRDVAPLSHLLLIVANLGAAITFALPIIIFIVTNKAA